MNKLISVIKKDTVLFISLLLAIISCFFITPDASYFSYIDFKTLSLLFCLMAVMVGFTKAGLFDLCARKLLKLCRNARSVVLVFVMLCFFFSAFITNDVALITFVPFAITTLKLANCTRLIPAVVALQTVAANMGSALTPIGNPQNIYIYSISDLSFGKFFTTMFPFGAATLIFLLFSLLFFKRSSLSVQADEVLKPDVKRIVLFSVLFAASILSVLKMLDFRMSLGLVILTLLFADRKVFTKIDYSLLLTFIGFFIFVGNMGRIPFLREQIEALINTNEVIFSALLSQIISNVPAALLLSGFTDNFSAILIGVNIGGLGTVIASMASLISYKFVAAELPDKKGFYMLVFSCVNFGLLIVMLVLSTMF